jgi:Cu-Zn family superoxide dismutase
MRSALFAALPLALLFGCAHSTPPAADMSPSAVAILRTADGADAGRVTLTETKAGVRLQLEATGLKPGQHGFHIHTNGACEPANDATTGKPVAFGGAGGHFDPHATKHHGAPGDASTHSHAGELPNLVADAGGRATLDYVNAHVTLSAGDGSVLGRSLIVHADPDDYTTNPAGNSGARVLCGRITAGN